MDNTIEHMHVMCRALIVESKRNGPVVLVYDWDSWPRRVRESRGWQNARVLYHRPASEKEMEMESNNTRCKCYVYDSVEALIEDEARFGIDARALMNRTTAGRRQESATPSGLTDSLTVRT